MLRSFNRLNESKDGVRGISVYLIAINTPLLQIIGFFSHCSSLIHCFCWIYGEMSEFSIPCRVAVLGVELLKTRVLVIVEQSMTLAAVETLNFPITRYAKASNVHIEPQIPSIYRF